MITIIIPVYNVQNYLIRCLESVINQTIPFKEVILINDGSTDESGKICSEYSEKNAYIKYIKQTNSGLSVTRNKGIHESTQPWIMFLDSDDEIGNNAHQNLINIVNDTKVKLDVITTNLIKNINGRVRYVNSHSSPNQTYTGIRYLKNEFKNKTYSPASTRNIYNKEFLLSNNILFEPELLHEDELYNILVFLNAKNVFVTDLAFYIHHIRVGSITQSNDKSRNAISINQICNMIQNIIDNLEDYDLKKVVANHFVNLSFYSLKQAMKNNKFRDEFINKEFVVRNKKGIKNRVRTLLLRIHPNLLKLVDRV